MRQTKEPIITINGRTLPTPDSMTLRVAIESFAGDLHENGLGEDDHGKRMVELYLQSVKRMRKDIFIGDNNMPEDPMTCISIAMSHIDNARMAMSSGDKGSAQSSIEVARSTLAMAFRAENQSPNNFVTELT